MQTNLMIMRVALLAFTLGLCALFHNPAYLWVLCLVIFMRAPKQARKSVSERFADTDDKLEQLAQLINNKAPVKDIELHAKLDAILELEKRKEAQRVADNIAA